MMFSVTEAETWKRCRRKRELSSLSRQALTPIWPRMNTLGLGTLVHQAGEAWIQDPTTPFDEHFYQASKAFYAQLMVVCEKAHYRHTDAQDNEFWEAVTLGRHMCRNYQDFYKQPLPNGYTVVRPEQQFVVPIPGTEHCKCIDTCAGPNGECDHCWTWLPSGMGDNCVLHGCACVDCHYLEGTLDAVIGDEQSRLFVYERKTFGQHPAIDHLNRVWQFVAYSWILHQAVLHWGTNNEIGGLLYDGLWKRNEPPKTGKYANNRSSLFLRHYVLHNPDTIEEFGHDIAAIANEMASPNIYITHTIPAVRGCWDCDFTDICDAMTKGEDSSLTLLQRTRYTKRDMTPAFKEFYASASGDIE
jgi:hypothetical protein